ncbi:MAG: hypothetical protein QM501_03630 [Gimesia sp.]
MKYSKSVSFSACLLTLTGLYGCQTAQQKVYQQASNSTTGYHSAPYRQTEQGSPEYQNHNQFFSEPAPAPVSNELPPPAPPSLLSPQTNKQIDKKRLLIIKTSNEEFGDDQEYFKSEFSSGFDEPAEKNLGLVPRYSFGYSSVSRKMKQMNGKVKGFCSNMKSHLKSPRWIQKISGSHTEEIKLGMIDGDISCVESSPFMSQEPIQTAPLSPTQKRSLPVFPEPLHSHPESKPVPLQPQPEPDKKGLPQLPLPKQTTTFQENSWNVSATIEQLPVKDYSTLEDQIELWPYSKQRLLQRAQVKQFRKIRTATPLSTPRQFRSENEMQHPRNLSVPSMLTQENSAPIRKISLQQFQDENNSNTVQTLQQSPIEITPRKY